MYKALIKPLFFLLSPEKAHYLAMNLLSLVCKIPGGKWLTSALFSYQRPSLEKEVFGIKFPNPVGLAAGFDKDARWIDSLDALGFGFIEIGTLTPKAQDGNPKPRLFRLPEDESLINRMGFNNQGVDAAVVRLRQRKSKVIVGGNIGKNKVTPNEKAVDDYAINFLKLFDVVDYFVVNVSSPNTPNLRALQEKEPLKALLSSLQTMNLSKPAPKPILLKIAPDLTNSQLDDVVEIVTETGIAGIIATNTTISRDGLVTDQQKVEQIGAGGLSGKVLKERSTEVIRYLHTKTNGGIPIIGVGGISTAADAKEKLDAGASLVQVYSGFIYEGPSIVKNILKQL
ncbi:MAG: quinone-dependent dihydroorotate dehydrogenase [Imperialibacter sp.]|uniref:quinone-dependent dihydroorotate dehydrogenase n=1 Tax=Imperialibacter sp. TaxID=2038411 RepID=UPI0032EC38AB